MLKIVKCGSCQFKGKIRVQKGQKVKYVKCPGCGKPTLK